MGRGDGGVCLPLQPSASIWNKSQNSSVVRKMAGRLHRGSACSSAHADADSLRKFYDQGYWEQKAGESPSRRESTYSPVDSWEGRSQKSTAFSRLAHGFTVDQPARQIGVVGPQVLEMEAVPPGGIFRNGVTAGNTVELPPTQAERDMAPLVNRGLGQGEELVAREQHFANMNIRDPEVEAALPPEFMARAGSQADKILLLPQERRAIMEMERDAVVARKLLCKAEGDHRRRLQLLKARHPAGVIGVDSTANTQSHVYGEVARRCAEKEMAQARRAVQRTQYLASHSGHLDRLGFNPLEHVESQDVDPMATVKRHAVTRQFQGKQRHAAPAHAVESTHEGPARGPRLDTHERLFGGAKAEPLMPKPQRTQMLFDQDAGGRGFNIITGVVGGPWKPQYVPQERLDKRLAHPSQQSLERGRLEQGSMPASQRLSTPFVDPWL